MDLSTPTGYKITMQVTLKSRTVPFLILAGVVIGISIAFYHVVKPMLVPLFLAGVTVMLATPGHEALQVRLPKYPRFVALLMTLAIMAIIIAPISLGIMVAVEDLRLVVSRLRELATPERIATLTDPSSYPLIAKGLSALETYTGLNPSDVGQRLIGLVGSAGEGLYSRTAEIVRNLPWAILNVFIFGIATYFFFLDGQNMITGWKNISPLRPEHDQLIRKEFATVCRSVVWATLLAAVVQSGLLVIGVGTLAAVTAVEGGNWILLLGFLTFIFAMVPFVGATSVWAPTGIWLIIQGHTGAGVALLIWGGAVISTLDNVVKIWVIKDGAQIHPLLVFVCVFGGMKLMGILGVFVGPIIGAVLFAMIKVLRKELTAWMTPNES